MMLWLYYSIVSHFMKGHVVCPALLVLSYYENQSVIYPEVFLKFKLSVKDPLPCRDLSFSTCCWPRFNSTKVNTSTVVIN